MAKEHEDLGCILKQSISRRTMKTNKRESGCKTEGKPRRNVTKSRTAT
jgi:hypothetical protein